MASLTFKNLSSIPGLGSSLGSALQNKINPQPLSPAKPAWQQTLGNVQGQTLPKATPLPSSYALPSTGVGDALKMGLSQAATESGMGIPYIPKGPMSMNTAANTSTGSMNGISQPAMATNQTSPLSQATPISPILPATNNALSTPIQNTGTFGGFVGSLANQGNSPYNQATQGAIATNQNFANGSNTDKNETNALQADTSLQNFSQNQTPQVANAESAYNQFAQSSPYMLAAQSNPNVAADVASGRTSLLGQTFAQELAAKQQAVSNALTGQSQQITAAGTAGDQALTGVNQQIGAAQNAGNLAQTGQSNAQSALSSGASATSPAQNGYVLIDKQTGQPVGGNGTSAVSQGAKTDAQYQGALANATDNQAIAGAQNNIDSITQLINNAGLNKLGLNAGNATIQALQKNLSNSDYQTLNNGLASIDAALSKVTGVPVDIAQLSTSQGTSIIDTINNQVALAKGIAAGKISGQNQTNSSGGGIYTW